MHTYKHISAAVIIHSSPVFIAQCIRFRSFRLKKSTPEQTHTHSTRSKSIAIVSIQCKILQVSYWIIFTKFVASNIHNGNVFVRSPLGANKKVLYVCLCENQQFHIITPTFWPFQTVNRIFSKLIYTYCTSQMHSLFVMYRLCVILHFLYGRVCQQRTIITNRFKRAFTYWHNNEKPTRKLNYNSVKISEPITMVQ